MKKLLILLSLSILFNSCNKEKEINLDCKTYKVVYKDELRKTSNKIYYTYKNGKSKSHILPFKESKYFITYENGHKYLVNKLQYDNIKVGEKIKECKF